MKALVAALALLAVAPAAAIEVTILRPAFGEPAFGEVAVEVEVRSTLEVVSVELFADGRSAGRLEKPPFRWTVEVGDDNAAHRFEVVAEDSAGETARAVAITPAIRVDQEIEVELRQLYVTAERGGEAALDLEREDFVVLDDGVRQELVTFERGDVPLAALILIDASDSMRGTRLGLALEGARTFIRQMAPLDQAMLLLFADRVIHATPFTGFSRVLSSGLERAEAGGGTALVDHLYAALELLETRQGRRVVILLSDGVDTTSVLETRDAERSARRGQALVYWLRVPLAGRPGDFSSAWRDAAGHRDQLTRLEELVRESGGRIVPLASVADAAPAFEEILAELRGQYVLGYYPHPRHDDGRWRRVKVKAGPGIDIRSRAGYADH